MKTGLVYPYRKQDFTGCNPPISLLYLAAALKQADEDVLVIDSDDGNLSCTDILKRLISYCPDLIGIPLYSTNLREAYELVNLLAAERVRWRILLGGPHATARAEEVLQAFSGCEYVLRGESERSIVELTKCLEANDNLASVKGLSYRLGQDIVSNPDAPLNLDLDSIPFPARELLDTAYKKNVYWRVEHRGATDVIITSRGCPYNCNFCYRISKRYRTRSPGNILEELTAIRSRGIRNVHVMDDLFVWDKPRCLTILDMIKNERLGMEFKVRARVDFIDMELLLSMKEAGVKSIVYGVESGSQKILDAMNKRTTVEMNYRAIELTKKAGLKCYADAFLGYPGETPETIRQTQELFLKAKPTAINVSVLFPLPDTKVYREAEEQGTLMGNWGTDGSRAWVKLPWIDDQHTLWRYRNQIYKKYLRDPTVLLNIVRTLIFRITFEQIKYLAWYYWRVAFKH